MSYKIKYHPKNGFVSLIDEKNVHLRNIQFGIISIKNTHNSKRLPKIETVLIILSGKCSIEANGNKWVSIGERKSVFDGKAYGVYIPPDTQYRVETSEWVEIAACMAPSSIKIKPKLITPSEVRVNVVGKDNWERHVHDIVKENVEADKLVVGETFNPPGNWSSYPPHKHDENSEQEAKMEEIYFFKIQPKSGFGFQRLYTKDGSINETYTLENNDLVIIPKGYHPVVAAPGYQLYYLWVLAGESRVLKPNDDSNHGWIKG